jgi:hydroxypyruvate isomerase
MTIKQSMCIPMLKPAEVPLREFVEKVAQIGYPAVEVWRLDDSFPELVQMTQDLGLQISAFIGHESIASGFNDASQHGRIVSELREKIDIAAEHRVPGLVCFSGNHIPGQSEEQSIATAVDGLKRIAPYAEQKGINLNLEYLNSKVDHAGYDGDNAYWMFEVCRRVNSPRVKVLFDIYHAGIMQGNLIQTICDNIQWIGHFHTGGVPGRHDIDDTQEINYPGVCRAIAATGYDLYMAHEFRPKGDIYASLKTAFDLCTVTDA